MSSSPTVTQDSWESRIQLAAQILGLSVQEIEEGLASKEIGIKNVPFALEMLSDEACFPFGAFAQVFHDQKGCDKGPVRWAYEKLRKPNGQTEKASKMDPETILLKEKYGYKAKLDDVPSEKLLEDYDPEKVQSPIARVLKSRYGDNAVIVLDPETNQLAIGETLDLMTEVDRGQPIPEQVMVNGVLVRPLAVGEQPKLIVPEDPMFAGHPLKRNRSTVNHVNWEDVPTTARQLSRIIVERGQINPNDRLAVASFIDLAKNGIDALKGIYPEAYLDFRERAEEGDLPKLVIDLKKAKAQHPFSVGRNRRF